MMIQQVFFWIHKTQHKNDDTASQCKKKFHQVNDYSSHGSPDILHWQKNDDTGTASFFFKYIKRNTKNEIHKTQKKKLHHFNGLCYKPKKQRSTIKMTWICQQEKTSCTQKTNRKTKEIWVLIKYQQSLEVSAKTPYRQGAYATI